MPGQLPERPKIYHILHVDRLASVLGNGCLWCDAEMVARQGTGTVIGMPEIKRRRLEVLTLSSHPGLFVGQCVPFYFCPRSVMLYMLFKGNDPGLSYRDGEGPIVHLEADLHEAVNWAGEAGRRWAFTLSNAGSGYFDDRATLGALGEIDWAAVEARQWSGVGVPSAVRHGKQAEFLVERQFPWELVRRIGVRSQAVGQQVTSVLAGQIHRPVVEIMRDWYYGD